MLGGTTWNMHVTDNYAQLMTARVFRGIGWRAFEPLALSTIDDMRIRKASERPSTLAFPWPQPGGPLILAGYLFTVPLLTITLYASPQRSSPLNLSHGHQPRALLKDQSPPQPLALLPATLLILLGTPGFGLTCPRAPCPRPRICGIWRAGRGAVRYCALDAPLGLEVVPETMLCLGGAGGGAEALGEQCQFPRCLEMRGLAAAGIWAAYKIRG